MNPIQEHRIYTRSYTGIIKVSAGTQAETKNGIDSVRVDKLKPLEIKLVLLRVILLRIYQNRALPLPASPAVEVR